jgi:HK97 family phage major capsid protein
MKPGTKLPPRIEIHELLEDDPKRGFRSAGEFFYAVRREGMNFSNPTDARLKRLAAAPTTYGNASTGADGGFLIPIAFAQEISDLSLTEDSLLPFCDVTPIEGNSMVFPRDETTPWGTTGVRSRWQGEGAAGTQDKPVLRGDTLRLNKLLSLVPVTNELENDATALGVYLTREMSKSIRWRVNDALLYGAGGYQPLGVFNSNAQVTIAKESGQATQTLVPNNLTKMMARLPPGSFSRAIWLFNGDVLTPFFSMTSVSTIYWPAVGDSSAIPSGITAAFGLVVGRPALISAHAKSFSSQGDVILLDLGYVNAIQKPGVQIATSLHVYFDADAQAFRASFRIDAQPKLTAPIAPANGSTQLSPFVQLGAR